MVLGSFRENFDFDHKSYAQKFDDATDESTDVDIAEEAFQMIEEDFLRAVVKATHTSFPAVLFEDAMSLAMSAALDSNYEPCTEAYWVYLSNHLVVTIRTVEQALSFLTDEDDGDY